MTIATESAVVEARAGAVWRFYIAAGVVFVASVAATAWMMWSMARMGGAMKMPGGWRMSMMWMDVIGERPVWAGVMFVVMWGAMMVAMMLPSAMPMLLLYRRVSAFRGDAGVEVAAWLVALGYFLVWTGFGVVACLLGAGVAWGAMEWDGVSRAVPVAGGIALVMAGVYQWTPWKTACLRHCQHPMTLLAGHLGRGWGGAMKLGLHHGLFCAGCCWGLMVVQLVLGVMNVYAMIGVAVIIGLEKRVATGRLVARVVGVAAVGLGVALVVRAVF